MTAARTKLDSQQNERLLSSPNSPSFILDPEIVAQLAHSYWEARGCEGGSSEEDWFRAEQELRGRVAQAASN